MPAEKPTDRLLAFSRKLHRGETPTGLLQEIADEAVTLTDSTGGALWLFEEETRQLVLAASHPAGPSPEKIRLPVENSLAGRVYRQMTALHIDSAMADGLPAPHPAEQSVLGECHPLLAAPITFSGEPLGSLVVAGKHDGTQYAPRERDTLETLAGYAGVAVQLRRARESIRQIAAEREELNRQKTDFIAITSHELRTPLGLVLGHATFLREIIPEETYQKQ